MSNAIAYADVCGKEQLDKNLQISESALSAGSGKFIFSRCAHVYSLLLPWVREMAAFRITQERMTAQKKACEDFLAYLEAPAIKKKRRPAATTQPVSCMSS